MGKVLSGVIGLVNQAVEDKDEANKLKAQLTQVWNPSGLAFINPHPISQSPFIKEWGFVIGYGSVV